MKQKTESGREVARAAKQQSCSKVPPYARPAKRGECGQFVRPCPYVGCRYNLALDVTDAGSIRYRAGTDWERALTSGSNCALDLAAEGPHTLDQVGQFLGCTRERVNQEIEVALEKLRLYGLQAPLEWGACREVEYVRSPEATDMQALGLKEDDPWIRKLWREHSNTTDEMP